MTTKTYEKKSSIADHILKTAYEDGIAAAERAYAENDDPRSMSDYRGDYTYPSDLRKQIDSWSSPFKTREDRAAAIERKKELEDMWFSWVRGWNQTRDHILTTRHDTDSGFGPAFMSPSLGMPYERYAGQRVVIESMRAGYSHDMARVRHSDGKSFLYNRGDVLPERRADVREVFQHKDALIEAAEITIMEMQRILKTLKGSKK